MCETQTKAGMTLGKMSISTSCSVWLEVCTHAARGGILSRLKKKEANFKTKLAYNTKNSAKNKAKNICLIIYFSLLPLFSPFGKR